MGDKLYIVIPAYNEEENIEAVIRDWHPVVEKTGEDSRLVIINDGSKDSTYEKMLALKEEFSQLEPLTKANSGHGSTILYGYNYALQQGIRQKEKMEEMRSEFLGNVSHELKTPIALIQGYAEGLKEGISK